MFLIGVMKIEILFYFSSLHFSLEVIKKFS